MTEKRDYTICRVGTITHNGGRFLNSDGLVSTGQGLLSHNMYLYCNNNPVNLCDPTGNIPSIFDIARDVYNVIDKVIIQPVKRAFTNISEKNYRGKANCYAFALKLKKNPKTKKNFTSKPQPGEFSGNRLTSNDLRGTKSEVKNNINTKVCADAKVLGFNYTEVSSARHVPKNGNWVVALAYASDGRDYHWWRLQPSGLWYHKPGSTSVTIWDSSGQLIYDPGVCNRGIYDSFLGYYEVGPN
jgi:hypothetical protein